MTAAPRYISRAESGLLEPRKVYPADLTGGTVVHWRGNPAARDTPGDVLLRQDQAYHMLAKGWLDIAYSFVINRRSWDVFVARGWDVQNGATAPGYPNKKLVAVQVQAGVDLKPPYTDLVLDPALWGLAKLHYDSVRRGGADRVSAHLDWYGTTCPGSQLTDWVRSGDLARRLDAIDNRDAPWHRGEPRPVAPELLLEDDDVFEHRYSLLQVPQVQLDAVPAHGSAWDSVHTWSSKVYVTALDTQERGAVDVEVWQTQHSQPSRHDTLTLYGDGTRVEHALTVGGQVGIHAPADRAVLVTVRYGKARWTGTPA